jgi:hypothetical protein
MIPLGAEGGPLDAAEDAAPAHELTVMYAQRYVDMPNEHGHILISKAAFPFEPTYAASAESAS